MDQLQLDLFAQVEADDDADRCVICGTHWLYDDLCDLIYGCDLYEGEAETYLRWWPCCEAQAEAVALYGYEDAYGVSIERVASLIGGYEVLEVLGDGDGCAIARLRVIDPTERAEGLDRLGNPRTRSPAGWQTEILAEVATHHAHHAAPNGWRFGVAVHNGRVRVGVAVAASPVSRALMSAQPRTIEVTRLCVWGRRELRRNAASKLYAAVCDRARELGYDRAVTYTLASEGGHSLRAAGWTPTGYSAGGSWARPSRHREEHDGKADVRQPKIRWERGLTRATRREVARLGREYQARGAGRTE